jgi:hypothetical protein
MHIRGFVLGEPTIIGGFVLGEYTVMGGGFVLGEPTIIGGGFVLGEYIQSHRRWLRARRAQCYTREGVRARRDTCAPGCRYLASSSDKNVLHVVLHTLLTVMCST